MDVNEANVQENNTVLDGTALEFTSSENLDFNKSNSSEFESNQIKDIEFGTKILLYCDYFKELKEFFDVSTHEYFERCFSALYPYFCLILSIPTLFKSIKDLFTFNNTDSEGSTIDLNDLSHLTKSGSDDTIHMDLDKSNNETEITLSFNDNNDIQFDCLTNASSSIEGVKLKQGSRLYKSLCSMTRYPDLYAPVWINLFASSSLFFSSCLSDKMISFKALLNLYTLYELIFLTITCTFIMALCILLCRYYFTKELKFTTFVSFLCVCGYTQIPLAILCKICIFISLLMFFHPPFRYLLFTLKVFAYFYLFISTSCTLYISLPPLNSRRKDLKYKFASIITSCSAQSLFLSIIQKYIH